jgi:glycosyltransferase involved in cell wall biosynthesis
MASGMARPSLRVLIIDHMAVEASRRGVYRLLADDGVCEVHLVVPPSWNEGGKSIPCEPERNSNLYLHISPVLFRYRTHRVVYLHLPSLIRSIHPDFIYMDAEPENYAALEALVLRKIFAPHAVLSLVSHRNIDHVAIGLPYKLSSANHFCDRMIRRSPVDVLFCRARETQSFGAPYAARVCYLPHSVDCSLFVPSEKYDFRHKEEMTIGFVGRITESKGVKILVEAFGRLPSSHRLVLVGRGNLVEEIGQIAQREGMGDRVSLRAPVPHLAIPEVMRSFDVLVLPSLETKYWKEQFGRVLIEAMACGVPVIASNSGGIPDVVGDAGLLFKTGSVIGLVESLSALLGNPAGMHELGRKGRERALTMFDVPVVANTLMAVLYAATPTFVKQIHASR